MSAISVSHLNKYYKVPQKEPGLSGSIKSLFNRKYNNVKAVDDVSFSIEVGELVGFIGPNGAGKTTTLKVLSGLLYPTSGDISVLGNTPFERKNEFLKNISFVMGQKSQLWWDLPAVDSFLLVKEIYDIPDNIYRDTTEELIKLLDIRDILKTPVRKLSLGQRMKCELIASLLYRPRVMFLDEPTIGLDVVMQKTLRDFVKVYNKKYESTILLTSHYMDDVKQLCSRIIVIDKGKIIYDGLLSDVVNHYATSKIISIILSEEIDIKKLEKYGHPKIVEFPKVVFEIPRTKVSTVAAHILKDLPIFDLNIEEPEIEDIIRKLFKYE